MTPRRAGPVRVAPLPGLLRRLRAEAAPAAGVVAVVLVAAFLAAAVPGWFASVSRAALRDDLAAAPSVARDLRLVQADRIGPGPASDPLVRARQRGEAFVAGLPPAVRRFVDDGGVIVDSPRLTLEPGPRLASATTRYLTLRHVDGAGDAVGVVEGRAPAPRFPARGEEPVIEVAVTAATAAELDVRVGDRVAGPAGPGGTLILDSEPVLAEITGIVALTDAAQPPWYEDDALHRPRIERTDITKLVDAHALIAREAYGALTAATTLPLDYTWRFPVDIDGVVAAPPGPLEADLARLDREQGGTGDIGPRPTVRSGLLGLVRHHLGVRNLALTVLSLAGLGALAVVLIVAGLLAVLLAERRAPAVALLRGRGASGAQLLGAQAREGALLAVPAAGLAVLGAVLLVAGNRPAVAAPPAAGVAVAVVLGLVAAVVPVVRRAIRPSGRDEAAAGRASPRRLAAEVAVVVLAVAGAVLLRRRGLGTGGVDPWLAVVPVLLGLAGGLVALRLYPLPLRVLAGLAARARGLVTPLALRRVARQPSASALPLLVIALSLAIAVFGDSVGRTVDTARADAAWRTVGADARLDGPQLPADLAAADGVEALAEAVVAHGVELVGGGVRRATLLAVDPASLAGVLRDRPLTAPAPPAPTPGEQLPALVSRDVAGPGDLLTVQLGSREVTVRAARWTGHYPGLEEGEPFVVVSLAGLDAATDDRLRPTRAYLRLRAGVTPAAALTSGAGVRLLTRAEVEDAVRDQRLVAAATTGFRALAGVALAFAGLALALSLVLTARARNRDLAQLRALGASPRQVLVLLALEAAPPVGTALLLGPALGLAIAALVLPALDLAPFTGATVPPRVRVDPRALGLLAAGAVTVSAAVLALAGAAALRTSPDRILRTENG